MSQDDFLDIQQKLFYTAGAWTGIRTGKFWDKVKGVTNSERSHHYKLLKELVNRNTKGFENLILLMI